MSSSSSEKQVMPMFTEVYSVTNVEDIEGAKSLIAWQIFEEFLGSTVEQQREQIVSMFNDYCREHPQAVECSIYL